MKTIIVTKDDQGLRINGNLVEFKRKNGIVSISNFSTGGGHSCHPNIDATGSVKGMKNLGYWRKEDKTVRAHGFIYNVSSISISDDLDLLAYHMEINGFDIPNRVLDKANSLQGISVPLPELNEDPKHLIR